MAKKHECDGEGCGLCFEDGCSFVACLCPKHKAEHDENDGELPGFLVQLGEV